KGAGYTVVEACNGKDALKRLDNERIDLFISDVNMPEMDGLTLLKSLKMRSDTKFTPVIMLTTETEAAKKEEGRAAGAKAWVVKPFQPSQMLAAVSKIIAS
ncbi:MAG: two-component system chemotaxis response regulator CheY, partial [Oleispira sp.]